ncbi:BON domain-containing protein [Novipirellula artificiosorum]|uniref:BON domain protein n=1 Tax=Novipirellula artificiosorum TaxID=2528016 RepID=A0A5C6DX96_9BACT|nr:BON domain-containing protein [Novipirellula artificiosorum]TWU39439.1 BON domain protein [Novipirellula artificiosorum]
MDTDDTRPDEPERCIAEIARQRLHVRGYSLARLVRCDEQNGVIVLNGTVPSYFLKQMAQETVRSIQGVSRIVSKIEVEKQ